MSKIGKFQHWLKVRSARYIGLRLIALFKRYGITPARAEKRTVECVKELARYGCYPTFPTPGRVVRSNAKFLRELQTNGAELAVHGHDHVDFRSLSKAEATAQFVNASQAFSHNGIDFEGFRCPYLSYTDELRAAIPQSMFRYSSNKAIWWDVAEQNGGATAVFDSLRQFYRAAPAEVTVATPRIVGDLLEIPVSVPDDIQLYDGLKLGEEGTMQAWLKLLHQVHRRGELFVLMFHPELFQQCMPAFEGVLAEAKRLRPAVWVTQLRDVSRWWWEKARFAANVSADSTGLSLRFDCSERATILVRHIETRAATHEWEGAYRVLEGRELVLPSGLRPFVGVSAEIPQPTRALLEEQGYIVDASDQAPRCPVYLDAAALTGIENQVQLIDAIESTAGPLVRFWRWPNEAKSALCVTGDLDALSLVDYVSRLFTF